MSRNTLVLAITSFLLIPSFAFSDEPNDEPNYAPGEVLVQFAPQGEAAYTQGVEIEMIVSFVCGGTVEDESDFVPGLTLVELPDGLSVEEAIIQFKNTPGVLYAQPNYIYHTLSTFPNDTMFNQLWGLHNTGQTGGTPDADIDAPEAWNLHTDTGNIIVAVIDTGVDYNHPDLAANMWHNPGEIPNNGIDDDGNGYIDDIYGYDFCQWGKLRDSDPNDDFGHGTHCAGIIGAVGNNSQGVTGVCWNVKIMALKWISADGHGKTLDAIDSIGYAVANGAKVLSNSWGMYAFEYPGLDIALRNAIEAANAAGVLFIAAAGNEGRDYPRYPARFDCNNIISVMATDANDIRPSWSNYGPTMVDLAAPGVDIYSCWRPGGGYDYMSGTSMATPYVAGAAALVWAISPSLSHLQVKDIVLDTADRIPTLNGLCVTGGRLNLYNALLIVLTDKILENTDDVGEGDCVEPGEQITYTLNCTNPPLGDPAYLGTLTDVNIVDYLPDELEFVSASGNGTYDSASRTVRWPTGTILPGDTNSVTLTVKMNILACSVIENCCEIKTGDAVLGRTWENTPVCCASNLRPACGVLADLDVNRPRDVDLTWCPGFFAADVNGHDVYFGTDFYEVSEANSSWPIATGPNDPNIHKGRQTSNTYLAKGLMPYTTYFWRIDEVNEISDLTGDLTNDCRVNLHDVKVLSKEWLGSGIKADVYPDGIVNFRDFAVLAQQWLFKQLWPGPVWAFTTGLFIDNFDVQSVGGHTLLWRTLRTDNLLSRCSPPSGLNNGAVLSWDGVAKTMIYDYNDGWVTGTTRHDGFSEARVDYRTYCDWTIGNPKILSISYLGRADNDANETYDRMYVMLEDVHGHQGEIVKNPDADAQQKTTWQEWQIKLTDLNSPNEVQVVDMNRIRYMRLGFGDRCNMNTYAGIPDVGAGEGRVIFDNIRLKQCALSANFICDGVVNLYDLDAFAQDWLHCGKADLYPDCIVDFRDFAILAQQWLEEEP